MVVWAETPAATSSTAGSGPATGKVAGYIFGAPVPSENYQFAKRVSSLFGPGQERWSEADRERAVWEALILHYEAFRRGISATEEELEQRINQILRDNQRSFTRANDPAAYAQWVAETLQEDVALFEGQVQYLLQIDKLKDHIRGSLPVAVTEQEMQEEFLNEKHHVGGEMVVFDTPEEARALSERAQDPAQWEAMKAKGEPRVRPVNLMTLEAYIHLWEVPKEQIYAFHAMDIGSVGPPMPFGTQWCVYRLLEKRTGDLKDFPRERESYHQQLKLKKQYEGLQRWIEELKASAQLKVLPLNSSSADRRLKTGD